MTIKVVVFDFDGTLIASNQLKYEAFFDLFPDTSHYRRTIRSVLADMSGESRYAVLDTLLRRFGETREADRTPAAMNWRTGTTTRCRPGPLHVRK